MCLQGQRGPGAALASAWLRCQQEHRRGVCGQGEGGGKESKTASLVAACT